MDNLKTGFDIEHVPTSYLPDWNGSACATGHFSSVPETSSDGIVSPLGFLHHAQEI